MATGFNVFLRKMGTFLIYVGVLTALLRWTAGPLMRALMIHRSESGAEFFVVGLYLSLLSGVGLFGLVSFEFSRLLSFERVERSPGV